MGKPLCSVLCVICYDLWSLDGLLFLSLPLRFFDMVMVFPIQLISFDLYVIDHLIVHDVRLVHFSMLAVLSWVSAIPQIAALTLSILLQLIPDLFPLRFFFFQNTSGSSSTTRVASPRSRQQAENVEKPPKPPKLQDSQSQFRQVVLL